MHTALFSTILLIVADDLSPDHLAAIDTPNIDRLAAEGVSFTNAWAAPVCAPTRGMIMTGRFPTRTGLGRTPGVDGYDLPLSEVALPEVAGWGNGFGKWHLGTGLDHPHLTGFRYFAGATGNLDNYFHWNKNSDGSPQISHVHATVDTVSEALTHPAPFMYVAFHAPHKPVHQPPGELEASFAAMVRHMDGGVGRLMAAYPAATVIFVGDNGTATDHGGGKGLMLESGILVPLIIAGPAVTHGSSEALVNVTDLFATVAELSGNVSQAEDSVSLVPYLVDPAHAPLRQYNYTERFQPNGFGPKDRHDRAIRNDRFKLIRTLDGERFYDLQNDPTEAHPIAPRGPHYVELSRAMEEWFL